MTPRRTPAPETSLRLHGPLAPDPAAAEEDLWPQTSRAMPWLLAGFLVMLWWLPFQSIQLPVRLPVDSQLDRFFLAGIAVVWVITMFARPQRPKRRSLVTQCAVLYVIVAVASVFVNLPTVMRLGQLGIAEKKLGLLFGYVLFFFMVKSTLRPGELRRFGMLLVGLAAITALGVVVEYRTRYNVFYEAANTLLGHFAVIEPPDPDPNFGRPSIVGPTRHGLAVTTMLAMTLPFAVVLAINARRRLTKALYLIATMLMLAGMISTLRKTSFIVPSTVLLFLLAYWPRQMLRLLPAGFTIACMVLVLAPSAAVKVKAQFVGGVLDSNSSRGRTNDYPVVRNEFLHRPLLGRGYGTYDSQQRDRYRVLDNEYLGELIEMGILGIMALLGLYLATWAVGHTVVVGSRGDLMRAPPALAAAAACAGYAVATMLFDISSFFQAPYLFFFMAGVLVVAADGTQLRIRRPLSAPAPIPRAQAVPRARAPVAS